MATMHLADLGADVIRIGAVGSENAERAAQSVTTPIRDAAFFREQILNRNKRSMQLNLKSVAGRDIFFRLAESAQVIVEGFRPGVVDRLGIGYRAVRERNRAIVYCSISGYGQTGPNRLRAGHDINYLAVSGVGDQIGVAGGPPAIPNFQVADILGGSLTAVTGILAALLDARETGNGRYIDVAMTDSVLAHSVLALAALTADGKSPERGRAELSGNLPCYNYYRAADGRYLAVGALEKKFWDALCDALEREDLKAKHAARGEEGRRVYEELQNIFEARDSGYWMAKLEGSDCCVSLVLNLEEALKSAQIEARKMVVPVRDEVAGELAQFAMPFKMSEFDLSIEMRADAGTQCDEILREHGYSVEEIAKLKAEAIVA